jgi:hypothetical protein
MVMKAGRALRAARAAVFSALCVLLAALGHVMMSGAPVARWMLLVAFAGVGMGSWAFASREHGPLPVVGAALGTQAFLHLAFSAGQALASTAPAALPVQHLAEQLLCLHAPAEPLSPAEALRVVTDAGLASHVSSAAPHPSVGHVGAYGPHTGMPIGGPPGMFLAHLVVALLGAVWLWHGERAVFGLVRRAALRALRPVLWALCRPAPPLPLPAPPRMPGPDEVPRPFVLVHTLWSRGPPGAAAVRATAQRHGRVTPA